TCRLSRGHFVPSSGIPMARNEEYPCGEGPLGRGSLGTGRGTVVRRRSKQENFGRPTRYSASGSAVLVRLLNFDHVLRKAIASFGRQNGGELCKLAIFL